MEKLQRLISLCKCGVYLTVNEHRDNHQTVEQLIAEWEEDREVVDLEVRKKMIETNTTITLQFSPETSIGFFRINHYDLEAVLNTALRCLESQDDDNGKT